MESKNKIYRINIPKVENITLRINEQDYFVNAKFSLNDLEEYFKDKSTTDSHVALCNLIYKYLEKADCSNLPNIEDIYCENENVFKPFIDSILCQDAKLNNFYLKTNESMQISERFALATKEYIYMISENIKNTLLPYTKKFEEMNRIINTTWKKGIQRLIEDNKTQFEKLNEQATKAFAIMQDTLSKFSRDFSDAIAKIKIPSIDEEEKQELQLSYKFWGSQGWTVPPNAPITLFKEKPVTQKECDIIALSYLKKNDLSELFESLNCLKIEDIESALFCFEKRQYKACSLLLFAIIDNYLIKKQTKGVNRKKVGLGAVKELEKSISINDKDQSFLFTFLIYINLTEALNTFFASGNDFIHEPDIINRNFINHGMSERKVHRKDCIQLFLVLYNMMELIDTIFEF